MLYVYMLLHVIYVLLHICNCLHCGPTTKSLIVKKCTTCDFQENICFYLHDSSKTMHPTFPVHPCGRASCLCTISVTKMCSAETTRHSGILWPLHIEEDISHEMQTIVCFKMLSRHESSKKGTVIKDEREGHLSTLWGET